MKLIAALLLTALSVAPQDPAALIEQLRSDDVAVRDRAMAELERLGAAAEPELKKAVDDPDSLVSIQVRRLLRLLELDRTFSPALRKAVPGIVRRLGDAEDREWTEVYVKLWNESREAVRLHPELRREDLEALAAPALRQATALGIEGGKQGGPPLLDVLKAIAAWRHGSAVGEVIRQLRSGDDAVRGQAVKCLEALLGRRAFPVLAKELRDDPARFVGMLYYLHSPSPGELISAIPRLLEILESNPDLLHFTVDCLSRESDPRVHARALALLKHKDPRVRDAGLTLLRNIGSADDGGAIVPYLHDKEESVAAAAGMALRHLDFHPSDDLVAELAKSPNRSLKALALELASFNAGDSSRAIMEQLSADTDPEIRAGAVLRLGMLGGPRFETVGVAALRDPEPNVRKAALRALEWRRAGNKAVEIGELLKDTDREVRRKAFQTLDSFDVPVTLECLESWLMPATGDEGGDYVDEDLVADVMGQLATFHPVRFRFHFDRLVASHRVSNGIVDLVAIQPEPAPLLIKALDSSSTRDQAVEALLRTQSPGLSPMLLRRIEESKSDARSGLIQALARVAPADARPAVLRGFEDESIAVRVASIHSLSRIGPGGDARRFLQGMRHEDSAVRHASVVAARAWKPGDWQAEMRRLLKDESADVATEALKALAEAGDPEAVAESVHWIRLRSDEEGLFYSRSHLKRADAAELALSLLITSREFDSMAALLEDRSAAVRSRAARILGRAGARTHAKALLPLLDEAATREAAVQALIAMGELSVIPELAGRTTTAGAEGRVEALRILMVLENPTNLSRLRKLVSDEEMEIRLEAIRRLGRLRDPGALTVLKGALDSTSGTVRVEAMEALAALETPVVYPLALERSRDPFGKVREVAEWAAITSGAPEAALLRLTSLNGGGLGFNSAIETVVAKGLKQAVPALRELVRERYLGAKAAVALAELGDPAPLAEFKVLKFLDWYDHRTLALYFARKGDHGLATKLFNVYRAPESRFQWAVELCESGVGLGAPLVVSEVQIKDDLQPHSLNALRKPELWKKLKAQRQIPFETSTLRAALEDLGRRAGLAVRWAEGTTFEERAWARCAGFDSWFSGWSAVEELNWMFRGDEVNHPESGSDFACPWDYILEDTCIRVVPRKEAVEFWKKWWADTQPKDKK